MALPNSAIFTPNEPADLGHTVELLTYVLRVTIDNAGVPTAEDLNFPASGPMTADRNYWMSGDGQADSDTDGGTGDLMSMLAATLDSHSDAAPGDFSVIDSDGVLDLRGTNGGHEFTIHWGHANTSLDYATFGFDASDHASGVGQIITAPAMADGIWLPGKPTASDSRDRQPVVGNIARTTTGLQRTALLALPKKERDLGWRHLNQSKVLEEYSPAAEPFGSFEYQWLNSIAEGARLRYYPDATVRTAAGYSMYRTRSLVDPMKRNEQWQALWDISLQLVRGDD